MVMKKIFVIQLLLLIAIGMFGQGIEFEQGTFQQALDKAKQENKMVFMDCYTTWCGPCKSLAKNIFPQKEVGDVFNQKFVNVKMDMEKGEGIALQKKYSITAFPTLLFLDAEGKVVHKKVGGTGVGGLIEEANMATDPGLTIESLAGRYDNGERDVKFLFTYVESLFNNSEKDKAIEVGTTFMTETPKDQWYNVDAFAVIGWSQALKYKSEEFNYIVSNKEHFVAVEEIGESNYGGVVGASISRYLNTLTETCSMEELKEAVNETRQVYESPDQGMFQEGLYDTWYLNNKQYDKWFERNDKFARDVYSQDKGIGCRVIVNVVNKVATDPEFKDALSVFEKAIDLTELVKEANKESHVSYYYLALFHKRIGNKKEALDNVNTCLAKHEQRGARKDSRITGLKHEIEAM
jgi:thiol-disulfide isomerase/thioredoxin